MMNNYEIATKKNSLEKNNSKVQQEMAQNVEHPIYEPKFIRGPTEYQTGRFRCIREGPYNKSSAEADAEELGCVKVKSEAGESPKIKMISEEESDNADLSYGELPDRRKVILSARKSDGNSNVNTFEEKNVDMARAKALFKNGQVTYAEKIEKAFFHFLEPGDSAGHFIKYLEEAAHQEETEDILKVFPFLKADEDLNQLKWLLGQKEKNQGTDFDGEMFDHEIAKVRAKIYDDQLKKVQFKKRIEKLLKEVPESTPEDEEFWLWVWLRKLLKALEDEIKSLEEKTDFNKPM